MGEAKRRAAAGNNPEGFRPGQEVVTVGKYGARVGRVSANPQFRRCELLKDVLADLPGQTLRANVMKFCGPHPTVVTDKGGFILPEELWGWGGMANDMGLTGPVEFGIERGRVTADWIV